jgi:hypothetical protein
MNALCNSQIDELGKFLMTGMPKDWRKVTFARFTGQEGKEERERLRQSPPDILLTNFMMLELMMTRQDEPDITLVRSARGLRFLVLDELHTYRGRQGADVAMLVRRVREAFNERLLCIGTSATMASEGTLTERSGAVARVASRLFGSPVAPENIITETLERVTGAAASWSTATLASDIKRPVWAGTGYETLRATALATWVETKLGLAEIEGRWVRARPQSVREAAALLAQDSGVPEEQCRDALTAFLLRAYTLKDGEGHPLFVFRLHQFISGAGNLYTTLEPAGKRYLTVNGQQFKPGARLPAPRP